MANKLNKYQLLTMLTTMTRDASVLQACKNEPMNYALSYLQDRGSFRFPFDPETIFVTEDRLPIFADTWNPRKSNLVKIVQDRMAEICLIADSILSGTQSLYLASCVTDYGKIAAWLGGMYFPLAEVTLKVIDDESKIILTPLRSFLMPSDGN